MTKEKFKRYAELKVQEKQIKAEIDILSPEILEEMGDNDQVETEQGVFTKGSRRSWTYPEEIEKEAEALKEKKKVAEQTGTATSEEIFYPIFKGK